MSQGGIAPATTEASPPVNAVAGVIEGLLKPLNRLIVRLSQVALIAAAVVLTYSVTARYFLGIATYWQDEMAVFLLVGATFMSAAFVQAQRGHVGIEALAGLLPAGIDRARRLAVDALSLAFCAFFAWKSWTLTHEAWVDGQVSSSTWAPPLWIPYVVMALGMSLLSLQLLLQVLVAVTGGRRA